MYRLLVSVLFLMILPNIYVVAGPVYEVRESNVKFHSKAPKELISAASGKLTGVVDIERKSFAFRIAVTSFEGFNSPLQREHFNENYMETVQFLDGDGPPA